MAECFYCERTVRRIEMDHAPIPQSAGGVATVPSCKACHHMKDRMPLDAWPVSAAVAGARDLIATSALEFPLDAWPDVWDDLCTEARLMWVKFASLASGTRAPCGRST